MLPYWQENLRVQMKRLYKKDHQDTIESLSQCWGMFSLCVSQYNVWITHIRNVTTANKWFLGCQYPRGVHAIIDEWPAPRKEDVDESIKLPEYENIIENTRTIPKPITENSNNKPMSNLNGNESENEDIDLDLSNNNNLTTNNNLNIGRKRSFNELNDSNQNIENPINSDQNVNHPIKKLKLSPPSNDGNNNKFIQNDSISNNNNLTPQISNNNVNNSSQMLPISNNNINNNVINNNNIKLDKPKSKKKSKKRPRWG